MQHAPGAVGPFDRQRRPPIRTAIELHTPVEQFCHVAGAVLHQRPHGGRIAEAVSRSQGVAQVEVRRVIAADRGGNPALGIAGVAFVRFGLGEDENVAGTAQFQRRAKCGDTAANDEKGRNDAAILPPAPMTSSGTPVAARLDVPSSAGPYPVEIAIGLADRLPAVLDAAGVPRRRFIVSSGAVWRLHGERVRKVSEDEPILLPDGERFKTLSTVNRIYDALVKAQADRGAAVIAIGGGVVGDVAGFAAATYLRGLPVVQVPTTLLAQVDSAIGGKVGVNHPLGKNLIGAFHQPSAVVVDPAVLATLPRREFRAGLYEVIKYGVIASPSLFALLETRLPALFKREPDALVPAIYQSCRIKADIVASDERESGLRRILNFGHTAGHALEAVTKFRRFRHGEAIGYGMLAAAELSVSRGILPAADRERLAALIMKLGPLPPIGDLEASQVLEAIGRDKKIVDGRLHYVLPAAIGRMVEATDVTSAELEQALRAMGLRG